MLYEVITGTYVITRTWSLVDNCGNAAADQVQTITVEDNIAPTFTRPADITIYTTATCTYDASVSATGDVTDEADNCSTGLDATYTDVVAAGSCEGTYVITRTWSISRGCIWNRDFYKYLIPSFTFGRKMIRMSYNFV